MYVCVCKAVSERDLKSVVEAVGSDLECVRRQCGAATDCGTCEKRVEKLVKSFANSREIAMSAASGS